MSSSTIKQLNSDTINIVFFGTHDFAVEILQGLIDNPDFSVELVITQPDKPVGRKQELEKSAVKILAEKYGLKIEQPESLKNFEFRISNFELCIVAQYGLIVPQKLLDIPKLGFINIHTSLLPKYRGASPIQTALMTGETETGVTIMKMDIGMDTGSILLQKPVRIEPNDTYPILSQKLAKIGIFALTEAISSYISGTLSPQPQDNEKATYTKILTRDDGRVDFSRSAQEIYNQYRGLTPWPGVWTTFNDKRLKLLKIELSELQLERGIYKEKDGRLFVGCGENSLEVIELQLEGSKQMTAEQFINGYKNKLKNISIN